MASTKSFVPQISARAATGVIALTGCVLSAVVLANRSNAAAAQEARYHFDRVHDIHHKHHRFGRIEWAWDVLPVAPLAASLVWNLFSGLVLASGTYFWLPRRMHLTLDMLVAISSIVLPYISLIWNVTSQHRHGKEGRDRPQPPMPAAIKDVMIASVILSTIVAVMHVAFFCYGCKKSLIQQEEKEVAPPVYASENPFDDARSVKSLPTYEKGDFEVTDEKKEAEIEVVEVEQEFV